MTLEELENFNILSMFETEEEELDEFIDEWYEFHMQVVDHEMNVQLSDIKPVKRATLYKQISTTKMFHFRKLQGHNLRKQNAINKVDDYKRFSKSRQRRTGQAIPSSWWDKQPSSLMSKSWKNLYKKKKQYDK